MATARWSLRRSGPVSLVAGPAPALLASGPLPLSPPRRFESSTEASQSAVCLGLALAFAKLLLRARRCQTGPDPRNRLPWQSEGMSEGAAAWRQPQIPRLTRTLQRRMPYSWSWSALRSAAGAMEGTLLEADVPRVFYPAPLPSPAALPFKHLIGVNQCRVSGRVVAPHPAPWHPGPGGRVAG